MDFKTHLRKYLSEDEINLLISSFNETEKKGLYLNTEKMSYVDFNKVFPSIKHHPVISQGFVYEKDEFQPGKKIYHECGAYYIQEPSAMLVANFLNPDQEDFVLDLCAAPGGKTIQAALKMENKGIIIANDLSKSRANVLLSNIERMGVMNTVVTSLDFKDHFQKFKNYFSKIILDAPCSGSGMFRKSEEMKSDWTYEKVLKNASIQKELILMSYSMLKEGGTMVYSTCSYSYEEDEEVIQYLLENTDAILANVPSFEGEFRSPKFKETVHLFPSHFPGEGHYIALIKKPGTFVKTHLCEHEYVRLGTTKGGVKTKEYFNLNANLPKGFEEFCLRPGFFMSTYINDGFIPSHHASHVCGVEKSIPLTKEETVKYLRGESLSLNKKYPDGYYCVCYLDMNLGLVHSVNGTLKNLYPKGLRINADIESSF